MSRLICPTCGLIDHVDDPCVCHDEEPTQVDARQEAAPMKIIYIAGSFTASTAWDVERNVRRAEEAALEIAMLGAVPMCPHTMYRHFHGQGSPEFWYAATLALLRRCDAVLFLRMSEYSVGTAQELTVASETGMPIFYIDDGLAAVQKWIAA